MHTWRIVGTTARLDREKSAVGGFSRMHHPVSSMQKWYTSTNRYARSSAHPRTTAQSPFGPSPLPPPPRPRTRITPLTILQFLFINTRESPAGFARARGSARDVVKVARNITRSRHATLYFNFVSDSENLPPAESIDMMLAVRTWFLNNALDARAWIDI